MGLSRREVWLVKRVEELVRPSPEVEAEWVAPECPTCPELPERPERPESPERSSLLALADRPGLADRKAWIG